MLKWTFFLHVGLPLLVGSIILAAPAAVLAYFLTLAVMRNRSSRKGLENSPESG
jgi:hypothetical protein